MATPLFPIIEPPPIENTNTNSTTTTTSRRFDDEDDEDVCRICRNNGDDENPLRYPCACSGSIKYVHQDCLLQWLNHSNAKNCEVCKHPFSFSPVYADNAPARLPLQEFVVGITMKACHVLQFFLRLAFVLSVWLLIIPFVTFWIWRLAFVRSFGEAHKLFLRHISTTVILTDCLHGFLLSASIVFIFLGATSLRDYFRHLRELGGQEADRGDEGARGPVQGNRIRGDDVNGEDVVGQNIGGAGQMLRRNAENVAARLEMQAARLEAHVEQMFDGLDDADGAEDVPFDELVGMQGPVFHLVENAFTVLASNIIFLGFIIFMPFSVGRIVLHYVSKLFSSAASTMLSNTVPVIAETLKENVSAVGEVSSSSPSADLLNVGSSHLSDLTTLATGYIFISSLVFFYLGVIALIRYSRGDPLTVGRLYGIVSLVEAIPSLVRQFVAAMRHLMTMVKVAFLLVIELGVFPLMCGWWLDICTLRMFGKTISHRVEFFSASPLASSLLHWIIGIIYMLQISIFVSLLRGVLRPGVLYFLRDPADPNYNPFRDLIDDPVHKHARRVLLSVGVYGSLIVMLVFLPVKFAMKLAPSMFPLDVSVSDPFTEIPADLLLFQICVPFAIEHFKLRATIKALLLKWLTSVGWALSLSDYLLPATAASGAQENRYVRRRNGRLRGQDLAVLVNMNGANIDFGPINEYDDDDDDQPGSEYSFVLRIVLLLVLAWMTLLVFNSTLIIVPVSLGRALFNCIPPLPIAHGIKCNDLYAFTIGVYAIWTSLAGTRYIIQQVRTRRAQILVNQMWKWSTIVFKCCALLSIWVFVIPVLIGLLFELLVIVPMRVPVDESPVFLLYQDWALGLIFLKIWTRLVMLDHMAPLFDESWRIKFERVRDNGFSQLQGLWVLREIVIPIIMKLLTALCVPYVIARGLFPALGYSLVVNSAVYRFAWIGCLTVSVICFCAKRFHVWFYNLHNSIRDDRYLIGRRLHNFGEPASSDRIEASRDVDNIQPDQDLNVGLRLRHPALVQ
ncbi:RING-type E3 ubiquitin transferase [Ranunculus cassubicifolius]